MSLSVERAGEADIPQWLELASEVRDVFGTDMANDDSFHRWLKRSIAEGAGYCVRIDGELAGAMQFRPGRIKWLAVRKRFRRRGVGRALVAFAISSGDLDIRVTTFGDGHPRPEALAARSLYRAMGFRPDRVAEPGPDGTPREEWVWRRQ